MKIKVKDNEIVTPGELIAEDVKDYHIKNNNGVYLKKDKIYSSVVGIFNEKSMKIVKLGGVYIPKRGDYVVGTIIDMNFSNWFVDILGPYDAGMHISDASMDYIDTKKNDMTYYYDFGDFVFAKITEVTDSKKISLTAKEKGLGKLTGGIVTRINPSKLPRLIGTNKSMIEMIQKQTNTTIKVGQNGLIWIKGDPVNVKKVKEVVSIINEESHTKGLTKKIESILNKR